MKVLVSAGCSSPAFASKGLRMPSTADDVLAETQRPVRAWAGECKKRFDLESFIYQF